MNRGDRGVAGERGPKGDHGQTGDTGAGGETGRTGPRARGVGVLVLLVALYMTGIAWKGEHDSCVRGDDIRTAYRAKQTLDALRARKIAEHERGNERAVNLHYAVYYRDLARATPALSCGQMLPENGASKPFDVQDVLARARRDAP